MRSRVWVLGVIIGCLAASVACNGHRAAGDETTVSNMPDAENLPLVIVRQFEAKGIDENAASTLASSFCNELHKFNRLELLGPSDLANMLKTKEDQMAFGGCEDKECLVEIGEKTNADLLVLGTISKVGEMFVVQVRIADGRTGTVQTRIEHRVDSDAIEDLLPAMEVVAEKVIGQI